MVACICRYLIIVLKDILYAVLIVQISKNMTRYLSRPARTAPLLLLLLLLLPACLDLPPMPTFAIDSSLVFIFICAAASVSTRHQA
jgi:hypothetical protein